MRAHGIAGLLVGLVALGGCAESSRDKTIITDTGVDAGVLVDGRANIWVDPDGCQHWFIDDGVEGYMTPRLNRDGTPRCVGGTGGSVTAKDGTVVYLDD